MIKGRPLMSRDTPQIKSPFYTAEHYQNFFFNDPNVPGGVVDSLISLTIR
jgi:hypothetical protein